MVAFGCVRRLCAAVVVLGLAVVMFAASIQDAEARKRRGGYAPPYASIVIDVNTGRVLQATNADAPRFPASITKVMTLYMLFEQLERGRFKLDQDLRVSSFAARQAPSKIGFDAGDTITVEEAILALVTKSANDVAVVVAEAIGGDQETFADMMTRKARAIGMRSTTFKNASGLPNPEQVTTARDLTVLGRAIHDRFPRYWRYFQARNFEFAGRNYRNHNRLLGRVDGVDGIKTGFTRASGFNLLTSAKTGNRHLIAVVLGGRSGRIRDAQMASLVEDHLPRAFAGARQTPVFAEGRTEEPVRVAAVPDNQPARAEQRPAPQRVAEAPRQETQRPETQRPEPVRTEAQRATEPAPQPVRAAVAAAPIQIPPAALVPAQRQAAAPAAQVQATPAQTAQVQAAIPARVPSTPVAAFAAQPQPAGPQLKWSTGAQPVAAARNAPGRQAQAQTAQADPVTTASTASRASQRSGFVIQLGASDDERKARAILDNARTKNRTVLADAEAFTEKVQKGDATLFRARFGGFDDTKDATSACNALKRSGFACFVQRI
jgi:D-alanyl-D-alanine carboxypeptidase